MDYLESFDYILRKIDEAELSDELKEILVEILYLINTREGRK